MVAGRDLALTEKVLQFWIVERCGSGFLCLKLDALRSFVPHRERRVAELSHSRMLERPSPFYPSESMPKSGIRPCHSDHR